MKVGCSSLLALSAFPPFFLVLRRAAVCQALLSALGCVEKAANGLMMRCVDAVFLLFLFFFFFFFFLPSSLAQNGRQRQQQGSLRLQKQR